ncbi:hypothetical protein OSB04_014658 [Centaurea solstitialis]|uniref:Uncharacterized protein n=1 Tax=Centaurea solstitialis TaxID=347529 RepID=A0AA38THD4_9ASTR|nr:hypothetical protein OSB04_014658 [Centaurea solstitialis]
MAYTSGLRMLMDDLKKIIHGNHNPLFNNNPMILSERPQFQLLYRELDSIVQTLSNIHHHHELEKVRNLKKRFKDVAEEAQDTIDLYLSAVTVDFGDIGLSPTSDVFKTSLDLENVMKSLKSLKVEVTTINSDIMKMDPSPRINSLKTHSARDAAGTSTSSTRSPLGKMKPSMEEIVVGFDRDAGIIRDKLTEDTKQLCVVSIVGMGGLGKTTLATKLFNDPFIKYHFHIRAWATVSETYVRRDLLIQILTSTGGVKKDLEKDHDSALREKLHKKLIRRRYLIVIDDIWSIEAWDDLKLFFPHDNTASRILLTSRQNDVALHVKPDGFVHSLPYLTEEESWELLKKKVFHGDECPEWFIKPGRHIARKCHGLPLSVVVMAGVLAQEPTNQDLWEEVACSVSSYIVGEQKGCLETLALSYYHLPDHLRECFLYLGGFSEDFRINVKKAIRSWVAEGFIEEDGNRSLEDTAKAYLMDLINRNLVIVERRNEIGDVKACKLHDLVRELCGQKAKEEGFFLKIDLTASSTQLLEGIGYEQHRIFTNQSVNVLKMPHSLTRTVRTLCYFHVIEGTFDSIPRCFVLLRVLDLQDCRAHDFPQGFFSSLVHLRYLAIWYSHLVNLRHLWSNCLLHLPYNEKPLNLHSVSKVKFKDGVDNFQKCFPNIRKLALWDCVDFHNYSKYLELLPYLENLKLMGRWSTTLPLGPIAFPATLKKLSLLRCDLPWSDMSIIQLLPNLEVLKLENSFRLTGGQWDACEQQFRQLKLLKLKYLDIKQWAASSTSFPCLKQLLVLECWDLEEIPLEIGEIATLELIEIVRCSKSLVNSERVSDQQNHPLAMHFGAAGWAGSAQRARVRELQVGQAVGLSGLATPHLNKMAYSGLRILMDDLKKIIHGNHNPLFNNNPMILSERPQFQLLYQELDSIIQTLSDIHQHHRHHHHELETVGNLKKRLKDAAEEAQDIIDLYLSAVTVDFSDSEPASTSSHVSKTSLDLKNVKRSIESIKVEFMTIDIHNMKIDPTPRIDTRSPSRKMKPSMEEFVVGHDRDAEIVRDKLVEDTKQLSIVSIVGMGGIAFNKTMKKTMTFNFGEKLHKNLIGRRYLIIIDDIWSIKVWDDLKVFFPHENTGSRILLTTRVNEVALHVKPHGFVHSLPCLTEEESWELLKQKVFHGDECPEWLIKHGMQIAEKCHGLPLSVVVMAGVLAEESMNHDLWEEIACSVSSYIFGDQSGCLATLALSYHHLPDHLRECFLYLGGFPEDFRFDIERLIWLWVAEGFIEEAGNRSLEDTAKANLMDLINRNLVIIAKRDEIGDVIACKLHDLVRELCVQKAKEEGLFLKIDSPTSSSQLLEGSTYEHRRIFTNQNVNFLNIPHSLIRTIRTLLSFHVSLHLLKSNPHSFVLLRVLDLRESRSRDSPQWLALLVHLRCELPWSHMSIIQLLPNLEVLKLERNVFTTGRQWDASEQQFRQLKFLMLKDFDIKQWEASSASFPCLKHLSVSRCKDLEEIPLEIGEIATLELIEIDTCNKSVVESVKRIKQEQDNEGNDELKIIVDGMELSFYSSQRGSSESE